MRKGWKEVKLGEVADLSTGFPFKGDKYEHTGTLRVVRGENITEGYLRWDSEKFWNYDTESLEKYFLRGEDIVIGMDGSKVGKNRSRILDRDLPIILAQRVACVRAKSNICQRFLWLNIHSDSFQNYIESIHTGTSIPHISLAQLADFEIPLPPLPEQEAIAEVLSSLDDKIDLLHRQNKTLEAMAGVVFEEWCEGGKKMMSTLGSFVKDNIGGEWGKEFPDQTNSEEVNCIRGTDIADLQTGLPDRSPIRFVSDKKLQKIAPQEGDVIIEVSGGTEDQSTGRSIYYDHTTALLFKRPVVFSNFCRLLRPRTVSDGLFLHYYIRKLYLADELFSFENGTSGIKNLNLKALLFESQFDLPIKETSSLKDELYPLLSKVGSNKLQIRTLTQTRDLLLPRLLRGEVALTF